MSKKLLRLGATPPGEKEMAGDVGRGKNCDARNILAALTRIAVGLPYILGLAKTSRAENYVNAH